MFEFDENGNLIADDGTIIRTALQPVEKYTPDKDGYTERNPIKLEMLYHVAIKEDMKNA